MEKLRIRQQVLLDHLRPMHSDEESKHLVVSSFAFTYFSFCRDGLDSITPKNLPIPKLKLGFRDGLESITPKKIPISKLKLVFGASFPADVIKIFLRVVIQSPRFSLF